MNQAATFAFPFAVNSAGRIAASVDNDAIRQRIVQVLFTAPGERVNQPTFGCGLLNLVFEPISSVLAAAVEFSIGQALVRWMGDEIVVDAVEVTSEEATITVNLAYTIKAAQVSQALRVRFNS